VRQRIPPAPPPAEIDRFVERCRESFDATCLSGAPEERRLTIANREVLIRYRSPAVAERYRAALVRLEAPLDGSGREGPALQILCWDTESTGVGLPPMPWQGENLLHRDRVRGHTTGEIRATYQQSEGFLQLYDGRRALGIVHATSASAVPPWTDRAPFRTFIGWWATDRSMAMMHASCVATDRGAALIAGRSGAGKSTTAMSCVGAGFDFLCDDACIVELDAADGPVVHAVYGRAKLDPESVARLGFEPAPDGGALIVDPPRAVREARARVVLMPEIVGGRATCVEPIPRTDVLRTLVHGSILEGGGLGGRALQEMTRVVKELPCYRLLLGTEVSGVSDAVAAAIEAV
jgi:hypothetical protein